MKQIMCLILASFVGTVACSNSSDDEEDSNNICQENVTCPAQATPFEEVTAFDTCRFCHSSTVNDRQGAPASINFDLASEALGESDEVLEEVSEGKMPPESYTSSFTQDQRNEIITWMCCAQGS